MVALTVDYIWVTFKLIMGISIVSHMRKRVTFSNDYMVMGTLQNNFSWLLLIDARTQAT